MHANATYFGKLIKIHRQSKYLDQITLSRIEFKKLPSTIVGKHLLASRPVVAQSRTVNTTPQGYRFFSSNQDNCVVVTALGSLVSSRGNTCFCHAGMSRIIWTLLVLAFVYTTASFSRAENPF